MPCVVGAEVGQFMLFEMAPDVFGGVKFRGVGGQPFCVDAAVSGSEIIADLVAAVNGRSIPDDQEAAADMALEMTQELNHLRALDRTVEELEVKVHQGDPANHRKALPVEVILQDRSLALGSPRPHPMRLLAQPAFVNEDDDPALTEGFFLMAGHWRFFQSAILRSSRSSARPTGLWQLQPRFCRKR